MFFYYCFLGGLNGQIYSRIKHNFKILLLALIASLGMFFLIKSPNLFQASILNLGEIETIKQNKWDIAYKTTGNILDVFVDDRLKDISELNIIISYAPSIIIQKDKISSQGAYEIIQTETGTTNITINQLSNLDTQQSIILIPFEGNVSDITIEEGFSKSLDQNTQSLAIGSLNIKTTHN